MEGSCPVHIAINRLMEIKSVSISEGIPLPSEIDKLIRLYQDITEGKGKIEHIDSINAYLNSLKNTNNPKIKQLSLELSNELMSKTQIFYSHILNHHCLTQDCIQLSPPPCQMACPAYVDIPSYITLVGMGKYREALEVLWEDIPFPGTLGRVCIHPCEDVCRRGMIDEPISICKLKRVAYDYGINNLPLPHRKETEKYQNKIAIIGAGPAGLSAGYFLARKGYRPIIFEGMPEPGGMLRWGIPAYRLPRELLAKEIDLIKSLGVKIKTNIKFGSDITIEDLKRDGYEAIFIGIGAWCCTRLPIEGIEDNPNVVECLTFLRHESLRQSMVGERVVVIGGGNVAIDCVRTALRLNVKEVHLVYRRSRQEMPALKEEIEAAEEEGAIFTYLSSPVRVITKNDKIIGIECIRNELSEPDESGRRRPVPIKGSEYVIPADTLITAIGQEVDSSVFSGILDIKLSPKNLIVVNPLTLETTIPGVFAGGDVVTGPATVIEAVAAGKRAAESIHRYLQNIPFSEDAILPMRRKVVNPIKATAEERNRKSRPPLSCLPVEDRCKSFEEVELCYPKENAEIEAKRCLRCDICIACGKCVEACKEMGISAIKLSYVKDNPCDITDFLNTNENCIGCGSCMNNCPTGAITMEYNNSKMVLRMSGYEMSMHKLIRCEECGKYFITERHIKYLQQKTADNPKVKYSNKLCPECSRRLYPERSIKILPLI